MPQRDPRVLLRHMLDFAREACEMAADHAREDLDTQRQLSLSLTRLVEIVGEAAGQVPRASQEQYPQVPWVDVVGMRHRLIHSYILVDHDILWAVIQRNLPRLISDLEEVLAANGGTP